MVDDLWSAQMRKDLYIKRNHYLENEVLNFTPEYYT